MSFHSVLVKNCSQLWLEIIGGKPRPNITWNNREALNYSFQSCRKSRSTTVCPVVTPFLGDHVSLWSRPKLNEIIFNHVDGKLWIDSVSTESSYLQTAATAADRSEWNRFTTGTTNLTGLFCIWLHCGEKQIKTAEMCRQKDCHLIVVNVTSLRTDVYRDTRTKCQTSNVFGSCLTFIRCCHGDEAADKQRGQNKDDVRETVTYQQKTSVSCTHTKTFTPVALIAKG